MNSINHNTYISKQLEMSQLVEFDSILCELSDLDKKQRRVMYLRDARQNMDTAKSFSDSFGSFFKGMGLYLMPFAVIFLFLPMFFVAWLKKLKQRTLVNHQLSKALDYWHIERYEVV